MRELENAYEGAVERIEALNQMEFEEFRQEATNLFLEFLRTGETLIKEIAKQNRKFRDTMLKALKKATRAEMDAAFTAYENLKDRTVMLEWAMYSVFLMYRQHVLKKTITDVDRNQTAALFGVDLKTVSDEYYGKIWEILEGKTETRLSDLWILTDQVRASLRGKMTPTIDAALGEIETILAEAGKEAANG